MAASGMACQSLSLDSWLVSLSDRGEESTVRDRYKYESIENDIKRMLQGEKVVTRLYDPYARKAVSEMLMEAKGLQCLIIEGVPALDIEGLRNMADLCVYVECEESIRTQRLRSFYKWKGLPEADILDLLAKRSRDELPFVTASRGYADMIVSVASKE
jgi:uridine kinase